MPLGDPFLASRISLCLTELPTTENALLLRERTARMLLHRLLLALSLSLTLSLSLPAQSPPLRLDGMIPSGVRTTLTESWGTLDFTITNFTDVDRLARVLVFEQARPEVQYGRDIWVPANSVRRSWLLVGPSAPLDGKLSRELQMILLDRTDGEDRPISPPGGQKIYTRPARHLPRQPTTTLYRDEYPDPGFPYGKVPAPESPADETLHLGRTLRQSLDASAYLAVLSQGELPTIAEAFDGIDHFLLASNRLARDEAGLFALRQWVQRGGKVWALLDLVDPETLAPLLGDALDFQLIDRVGLTSFQIRNRRGISDSHQQHERPVTLARVVLPEGEQATHTVDGWPVFFSRRIGKGKVILSTLGPRGLYRPRSKSDPASPFREFPDLPIGLPVMDAIAEQLHPGLDEDPLTVQAFQRPLTEQIGYSIISQTTVLGVFAGFAVLALLCAVVLRQTRRPELAGLAVPVLALLNGAVFWGLGTLSRQATAETAVIGQIVEVTPGLPEVPLRGLLGVYHAESGPIRLGADAGGQFNLDTSGLVGQTRRLILTDSTAWQWADLTLPAGVRFAPFQANLPTSTPLSAVVRLGPDGIEGTLKAGPFTNPGDALLSPPAGRSLALRVQPDGTFRATSQDVLPAGQFLAGTLVDDRQNRRQELYRTFLAGRGGLSLAGKTDNTYLRNRLILFAWADPVDLRWKLPRAEPPRGDALLVVPVRLEPPAPGMRVTIPGPLLEGRRVLPEGIIRIPTQGSQAVQMHLRFQIPESVLPLELERARVLARITAPGRQVTLSTHAPGTVAQLAQVVHPLDPIRVEISEAGQLRLDEQGGLHLQLTISDSREKGETGRAAARLAESWSIQYLEVEVTGRRKVGSP